MPLPLPICFQLPFAANPCSTCGRDAKPVHVPSTIVGTFCAKCCPVCRKMKSRAPPKGGE